MAASPLSDEELKTFLDEKTALYNRPNFIEADPISIPHRFTRKEDIEISGFLAATIAWGQRVTIINNANRLMQWMDEAPYEFVMNASERDLAPFKDFKHRTFNGEDALYFLTALRHLYQHEGGLEGAFNAEHTPQSPNTLDAIVGFRKRFFLMPGPARTGKHVSNPAKGSSAKRLNMYLRWMVRDDKAGVDFGLWKGMGMHQLSIPLDVHTGTVGRKLGLLHRTQNDWRAVEEFDAKLRKFDPVDPIKYDFAVFGLGAIEKF